MTQNKYNDKADLAKGLLAVVALTTFLIYVALHLPRKTPTPPPSVSSLGARYVLELELYQSHFTLNLRQHLTDSLNTTTFSIPVDREMFDSVSPGQEIHDDFRSGSLALKGSFGAWKVRVKSKQVVQ